MKTWNDWRKIHQPFELQWQQDHGRTVDDPEADAQFFNHWRPVQEFIQPDGDIIDIGCGPRPPFPGTVIDPLADEYRKVTPAHWWSGIKSYAQPAEELVPGLIGDTVICWNCLDHTIGWRDILDNIAAYAAPGAKIAISTDFHAPFVGHPGYPREEFMAEVTKRFEITEQRENWRHHLAFLAVLKQ